ncbi:MAG: hypothetical protein C0500_04785 [Sphingobium sp.]|nr:hypothetical protein [Sphingobium sp.]
MARRVDPYWPALMCRATAARYCDMTPAEFEGEVLAARLPMPMRIGKNDKWRRAAIDDALDQLAGGAGGDWRGKCKLYAQG